MIYDPKRDYGGAPVAPTNCAGCGQPYQTDDQIVRDTDSALVDTYWHRDCLTRHVDALTAKWMAEHERRMEEAEPDSLLGRLRALLRREQ